MTGTVLYARDDHIATITYHRPEVRNAINGELRDDLNAAWERFRADDDAWVAIVTGAGHSFCVGADLRDGGGSAGTFAGSFWEIPTINSFESGMEIWKPTIAAVNGYCLGYGLTAVLACDFVLAADDAQFGFPEVRLGVPTIVGALRLPDRVGMQHALEILLTGDRIDAAPGRRDRPRAPGRPRADLLAEAHHLARRLCQGAPLAVRGERDGAPRPGPPVDRGRALRRDHAPRRARDRRRQGRHGRGPRASCSALVSGRAPRFGWYFCFGLFLLTGSRPLRRRRPFGSGGGP